MSAKIDNILLKLLAEVNGATFISIDTLTPEQHRYIYGD